jgi:antitoxin CptB
MKEMERLRWRCRRGLLELDIVLGRFVERDYATLNEVEKVAFDALLDLPDTVLWDMASGRQDAEEINQKAILEKIRTA